MAVLTLGNQVVRVYGEGTAEFIAFYALRGITAGDTVDLSADYKAILCGAIMGTVGAAAGGCAVASVAGTVVTMPAGPSNSGAFLMLFGVHA